MINNPSAGEILFDLIEELGISQNELARQIKTPANRVNAIISGLLSITADIDLRLCKFFGLTEGHFLRLQQDYDIMQAKHNEKLQSIINEINTYKPANDNSNKQNKKAVLWSYKHWRES